MQALFVQFSHPLCLQQTEDQKRFQNGSFEGNQENIKSLKMINSTNNLCYHFLKESLIVIITFMLDIISER